MLIMYHTCDHCGKTLDKEKDYCDFYSCTQKFDLCNNCYEELKKFIREYVRRDNSDS